MWSKVIRYSVMPLLDFSPPMKKSLSMADHITAADRFKKQRNLHKITQITEDDMLIIYKNADLLISDPLLNYNLWYHENLDHRYLMISKFKNSLFIRNEILSMISFKSKLNGSVWVMDDMVDYLVDGNRPLITYMMSYAKVSLGKSLQSLPGRNARNIDAIWRTDLPKIGIKPKIYSNRTLLTHEPSNISQIEIDNSSEYIWVINKNDRYHNVIDESKKLLMPQYYADWWPTRDNKIHIGDHE